VSAVRAVDAFETWLREVRGPRKASPHTTEAYRTDLRTVLAVVAAQIGVEPDQVLVEDLAPVRVMRRAFGEWAEPRAASSVRRGHSTWSQFFDFLVSDELVEGSPMAGVGKPARQQPKPKPFSEEDAERIARAVQAGVVPRKDPWPELERAVVLTDLAAGLRTAELIGLNVGDVNRTPGAEGFKVVGKGNRERFVPTERALLDRVLTPYLDTRRARFPETARRRGVPADASPWEWWAPDAPLFVGRGGERLTKGSLQYMVTLVYRAAGVDARRVQGALTHAMRHTAATRVAGRGAPVATLMKLFGWNSLGTPQVYVDTTGSEVRDVALLNPLYGLLRDEVTEE
jgi:integrase/recombinase XerC